MSTEPTFTPPAPITDAEPHAKAFARNLDAATKARQELARVLDGESDAKRILIEAAAGAGKSHLLKDSVVGALEHSSCKRIAVVAFTNRQIIPLARDLGKKLGQLNVCLRISEKRSDLIDDDTRQSCVVAHSWKDVPKGTRVVVSTSHTYKSGVGHAEKQLGKRKDDFVFDVVYCDEAWQLAAYLYTNVAKLAPVSVGVGDVGQLPPFDRSSNPYRGDSGYNPTRAWPTEYDEDGETWSIKLPAVWRPCAEQLGLWRMFYNTWPDLHCVAAEGDRSITHNVEEPMAAAVWNQVATCVPTLVEVDGLDDADAPDVDLPLMSEVERWLDELIASGPIFTSVDYDTNSGTPTGEATVQSLDTEGGDPAIALLATRNAAVEVAESIAERLTEKHDLNPNVIVASTVDSYQGQTNALTVAIHPLSGASELNEFNSAFGRLAVVCTRATHGLLLVSRPGLDQLITDSPARPGTPLGEPGTRELPRQTHQRILGCFARGGLTR